MWIKNTRGKPDALLTFAVVGIACVLLKFLASGVTLPNGFQFGTLDAALAGAIFLGCVAPYTAKRTIGGRADAS